MNLPHNYSPWFYLALMLSLVFALMLLLFASGVLN
jgi:hypothetical protein